LEQGQAPDTEVGRVYVYDLDDWDLPDKKFYWDTKEHPNFSLHQDTGMLTMRHGTRDGKYHLRFRVYDRKHTQVDVPANVTVTVREITHEAVTSSGSIRIAGISDEDFIRIWDYRVGFPIGSNFFLISPRGSITLAGFLLFSRPKILSRAKSINCVINWPSFWLSIGKMWIFLASSYVNNVLPLRMSASLPMALPITNPSNLTALSSSIEKRFVSSSFFFFKKRKSF
jgi:hypothetical protein